MADPRFYPQDLDDDNLIDLHESMDQGDVLGIVDNEQGGIIAYALGEDNANTIVAALTSLAWHNSSTTH